MKNKKLLVGVLVAGGITLAGVGYFVYKNVTKNPAATVEQTDLDAEQILNDTKSDKSSKDVIKEDEKSDDALDGVFQEVDSVHKGSGTATITQSSGKPVIVFSQDFNVTNGPDLYVYLSPNESANPLGDFVSLGKLKSPSGSQAYNLPGNYKDYKAVTVWCRAFNVKFTYANLR